MDAGQTAPICEDCKPKGCFQEETCKSNRTSTQCAGIREGNLAAVESRRTNATATISLVGRGCVSWILLPLQPCAPQTTMCQVATCARLVQQMTWISYVRNAAWCASAVEGARPARPGEAQRLHPVTSQLRHRESVESLGEGRVHRKAPVSYYTHGRRIMLGVSHHPNMLPDYDRDDSVCETSAATEHCTSRASAMAGIP